MSESDKFFENRAEMIEEWVRGNIFKETLFVIRPAWEDGNSHMNNWENNAPVKENNKLKTLRKEQDYNNQGT